MNNNTRHPWHALCVTIECYRMAGGEGGAEGLGDITCRDGVPEIRASTKGESDRSQGLNGERQMQKGTPRTHAGGEACP